MIFDWNQFSDPQVYNPASVTAVGGPRHQLVGALQQAFGPAAVVTVLAGGSMHNLTGDGKLFSTIAAPYGLDPYGNPTPQAQYYQQMAINASAQSASFLHDVSLNSLEGLFAIVSQMSPTGGKDFEDMALVDPSNSTQWLLIVAVDRGDDLDIYRKLYTGAE